MADGVKVQIGSRGYVVPRLTVGAYRRITGLGQKITEENGPDILVEQIVALLRKNYPELRAEALAEEIPFADLVDIHKAILVAAGAKSGEVGEGKAESP